MPQEVLFANIGLLVFTPAANADGAGYADFTFRVRDDGGTVSGGIDTDQVANTITFDVTAVNDAPTGADKTITTLEDTAYTFAAADFGFADAADSPANSLFSVYIDTLPAAGTLTLGGVAVTAGQEIAAGSIGTLVFTPAANANGAGAAGFTFQVQDDDGTANGGQDTDQTPNTITIDVISVNNEPIGADATLTTLEDTPYTFSAADFGFSNVNDNPAANNFLNLIVTTLPTAGTLTLSGAPVSAGQVIAVADIPNLVFTPAADANGAGYSSFTFQVQDDGGTLWGGVDIDQSPNTITFDVTSVNDAPDGTDNIIAMTEDIPYVFTVADFGFTDPQDSPANNFLNVIIDALPVNGVLSLAAGASVTGPVTAGQVISVADIPFLTYTPLLNDNSDYSAPSFTFRVQDDDGTANGGVDTDGTVNTITFDIAPVDDAPTLDTNAPLTMFEGETVTITTAYLSSSDVDTTPAAIIYTVTTPVVNGQLELTTAPGVAISSFTQDDLDNGRVIYIHNSSETTSDSFDFTVNDATTNIGSATFAFNIIPINDAPIGMDNNVTTLEDVPYTFSAADFGFTDPNDSPSNAFQSIIITTLPALGALELVAGASVVGPVSAGQDIAYADIPFLTFTPDLNDNGVDYGTFRFQVRDDGGTANGGTDLSAVQTMHVNVTPVNDAPYGLHISRDWFPEQVPPGWKLGNMWTDDVDSSLFTYSIVGSSVPGLFSVHGDRLVVDRMQIYGIDPSTYTLTLRTNDGEFDYDQTFTIRLLEAPGVIPGEGGAVKTNGPRLTPQAGLGDVFGPGRGGLPFYIGDTAHDIRNGDMFRYGNQGIMDSSLAVNGEPLRDAFYGLSGLQDILRNGAVMNIQEVVDALQAEMAQHPELMSVIDIKALELIGRGMLGGEQQDEAHNAQDDVPLNLYEENAIYKALVALNKKGDSATPEKTITTDAQRNPIQYLHAQLDEAALYYRSKQSKLMQALGRHHDGGDSGKKGR